MSGGGTGEELARHAPQMSPPPLPQQGSKMIYCLNEVWIPDTRDIYCYLPSETCVRFQRHRYVGMLHINAGLPLLVELLPVLRLVLLYPPRSLAAAALPQRKHKHIPHLFGPKKPPKCFQLLLRSTAAAGRTQDSPFFLS